MARFSRMHVLNTILDLGMVVIFNNPDPDTSIRIAEACYRGGAKVVEYTNRGDLAYQVFTGLTRHFAQAAPDLILGAGTILDPSMAALYIASGANFVVSPVFSPDVARTCNRHKVPYVPGCGSASEISAAEELGVEIVKVFPGSEVGGPSFVKNILGPCPWSSLMPTGAAVEISAENISAWFKAGAVAIGPGSKLILPELVQAGDFDAISERVAQVLAWIRQARP